jgi:hypothetical protein
MKQRIINILNFMVKEEGQPTVKSYSEVSENVFQLETFVSPSGHQTWLEYEVSPNEQILNVEIIHVFGRIDLTASPTPIDGVQQLLLMLRKNTGSYQGSSAYIGVQQAKDGPILATLNTSQNLLTKWGDEDIAKSLHVSFMGLIQNVMFTNSALTILKLT